MDEKPLFKREESRKRDKKSIEIFQEISRIKKKILFEVTQTQSHPYVGPLFSNWTYELGMTIKRESDLHAHCIGKQIRLVQWHAELYCLSKRYNDMALDLLNNFNLQHVRLFETMRQLPVGTSSLLWKEIDQLINTLSQLHSPMALFFLKKYARLYRIPSEDLRQICFMVLVESIHSFDSDLNFSFMNYYNIKLRTTLLRAYGKSCDIILSEKEMMTYMRIKYLLYCHGDNDQDPNFIKKCQTLFGGNIRLLMDEYRKKDNILHMADIDKMNVADPSIMIEEDVQQNIQSNRLFDALQTIEPLTRTILLMNFGFQDNTIYTREEIASKLDLSLQVVKRLKKNGIEELKRILS